MKFLILIALVAIAAADDYSPSYSGSSYSPSYSSSSYKTSYSPSYSPSYSSYSAPSYKYTQKVLVYPPPYYETVEYIGYTHGGKKGKKGVPVYKAVDKHY